MAAIVDYSSILNVLMQVQGLSAETNSILEAVMYQSDSLSGNIDLSVFNTTARLLRSSLRQSSESQEVLTATDSTVALESRARDKMLGLDDVTFQLLTDVMTHSEAIALAVLQINETLVDAASQLYEIRSISDETISASSSLLAATPLVLASVNSTLSVSETVSTYYTKGNTVSGSSFISPCTHELESNVYFVHISDSWVH